MKHAYAILLLIAIGICPMMVSAMEDAAGPSSKPVESFGDPVNVSDGHTIMVRVDPKIGHPEKGNV